MNRVKLKVLGLSYANAQNGAYALILADEGDIHRLPIIIGISEAQAIAMQLEKLQTQRPLTHDLIKSLTDQLDITLQEVIIHHLEAGIFYTELVFKTPTDFIRIDSRPSDAVALALRYGCDLYTTDEIIDKAGILVNWEIREKQAVQCGLREKDRNTINSYTVRELQRMLAEAIRNEDYEKASQYRDLLKDKEK